MNLCRRPRGITVLSCFFVFGAIMSGVTSVMLLLPGTPLEWLWRLNPRARDDLKSLGLWGILLMALVCMACATAALGLWRCTRWGFWTAAIILSINLAGDTVNAFAEHDWRTLVGLPIGGVMLLYLLRQRRVFLP
jgi:hypothetical protein